MRILMVVRQFYPWVGGTERQAQKLSQSLISQGLDVKVVTGWWFRNTPQKELIDGIPVYRNHTMWEMLGIRGLRKFGAYLYMITLFLYLWRHRNKYDIIHVHLLNYPAFVAVLAGKWLKKKTLVKIANSGYYSDILMMKQNQLIPGTRYMLPVALQADQFVALTPLIVKEIRTAGVPMEKIVEIPNGVEVDIFAPKKNYQLGNTVTLVFVGRLHPQKGLDVLLPAFQQAAKVRPKLAWRLLILGDGPLRSMLETMVEELGNTGEVIFCGQTNDVYAYLRQADIFVLPSRAEGMSNALLEAMVHGLPCIISRASNNSNMICHNKNVLVIDCENVQTLAQAIVSLVDDRHTREKIGQAARQTTEDKFAVDRIAEQYIALYQTLVNNATTTKKIS